MINIMYAVDPIKRIVKPMSGHAVTEQDREASSLRFAFPDNIAGTGLDSTGTAVRVMYIRPDGGDPVAKTLTFYKHSGGYYLYDWNLQKSDLQKEGHLVFSLCVLTVSEGVVSEEWHTAPYSLDVLHSIHTDDSDEADETITPTVKERVAVLESMIQRVASGAPIVVASTSAMTDTNQIYVLSTNGRWYYHNGSAWVAGGEYGAVATDTTLTQSGIPADAKKTGDEIADLKSALYDKIIYVGKGNTYAEYTYDGRLRPGNSYRVYVKYWDTTGITVTTGFMFHLGYTSNGAATWLYTVYGNDSSVLKEFYDVNIPDNAVNPMLVVGGRATGIAILGIENGELVLNPIFHSEVDPLKSGITALMLGNAPTKQKVVGKRGSSASAYDAMQINVESGRRYRIDMSNIDALVGADLYLRVRKADNSGNAYTATTISGNIPANTKWTYYFNCTVTESVVVQICRNYLTEDAIFSVGVLCDDDRRDISTLTSDFSFVNEKVNMDVSRNLTGPDLDVLYPIPPLNDNDVITISAFNPANVNSYTHVYFHEEDGTSIKYYQFDSGNASAGRQITLNLDGKTAYFIRFNHDCGSPLMVERGTKTDFIPHYTTNYEKYLNSNSNFGEFELFLPEQAEIIRNNLATARMTKRLCFGHVSDNHSTIEKFISNIVDMSDAKFIANTGDIVQDKFQDAYTNLPAMINAMTKPYYIALGNHDVYKAPSISDIFNKYFAPIIDHNGQTGLNKTYYSVDFTDEGIKCIFLDPYDAIANYSVSMETVIAGKMSATQINWFLGQLDAALASHMHVCVFLHLSPEMIGEKELKFFDANTTESRKVTYTFIPDVIDAFLDGGSVTFNYDGSSYTHTFASSGVFVGYFCGHMHCDCIGKLKTHNRQNAFSVTRPWQSSATNNLTDGTYRHGSSKWGSCTFNYVTVDPTTRHVSVMRVLQQETKYGFKRDFVTMEY